MGTGGEGLLADFARQNAGPAVSENFGSGAGGESDRLARMAAVQAAGERVGLSGGGLEEMLRARAAARGANVELVEGRAPDGYRPTAVVPPQPVPSAPVAALEPPVAAEPNLPAGPDLAAVLNDDGHGIAFGRSAEAVLAAASRIVVALMADPNYARMLKQSGLYPKDFQARAEDDAVRQAVRMFRKTLAALSGGA